jgi:hypothetical protein
MTVVLVVLGAIVAGILAIVGFMSPEIKRYMKIRKM